MNSCKLEREENIFNIHSNTIFIYLTIKKNPLFKTNQTCYFKKLKILWILFCFIHKKNYSYFLFKHRKKYTDFVSLSFSFSDGCNFSTFCRIISSFSFACAEFSNMSRIFLRRSTLSSGTIIKTKNK